MKKVLLIAIGIGLLPMLVQAQKVEGNPFARLGYQVDVFTFGKDCLLYTSPSPRDS